ncbi:MAG: hypothetical protein A3A33_00590 [Candidatus Yanofskybacteria bacterium RIFCSPLOWO2_01_FULL_49_25]|uniref:ABC transporter permease n=1 Tax=Candidatus Yanofskybacteria bacterium RIFCSPLOWO2_01_FULL_49_25 TaxID=1802701 RepID=A0A1F8GVG4_9BACT|nr:MAG: hypothetical protein A3A33_00590 [Candidatus Yanofskybacteria bacterium RIFCSPLOWO2_01_FULL_49_25]
MGVASRILVTLGEPSVGPSRRQRNRLKRGGYLLIQRFLSHILLRASAALLGTAIIVMAFVELGRDRALALIANQ